MGEMMKLTFKLIKSGHWHCREFPEVRLLRRGRSLLGRNGYKLPGWAVVIEGREINDERHTRKSTAELAAVEFVTARERTASYREASGGGEPERQRWINQTLAAAGVTRETHMVKPDGTIVERPQPTPVVAPQLHGPPEVAYGRVPAVLTGADFDTVTFAVDKAIGALKSAVEIAATQAVRSTPEETDAELLDRIVRRAKYDALRAMRRTLDGWIKGAKDSVEADGKRRPDTVMFLPQDIARMIDDAARECGTTSPYAEGELP